MKRRITGALNGGFYEVRGVDGGVMQRLTLADARKDSKLAAAIERNGWPKVPEE